MSEKSQKPSVWGFLLSKTAPEVTAATLLFIWMSLNMARPQTNWKGSTASMFANVQYSCLQPWYCGIIGTRVVSYANMAEGWEKKKNGQRYNTTFLSSGTSHNTVWDCAKEADWNYSEKITKWTTARTNVMQTDMMNSEVHVLEEVLTHLNVRLFLLSAHLFHQLGSLAHFPVRERSSPYHNHRVVPDLLKLIIIISVLLILLFSWSQGCSVVHSVGWNLRWQVFVRFTGITVRVAGVSRWNGRSGDDSTSWTNSTPLLMNEESQHHLLVLILCGSSSSNSLLGYYRVLASWCVKIGRKEENNRVNLDAYFLHHKCAILSKLNFFLKP